MLVVVVDLVAIRAVQVVQVAEGQAEVVLVLALDKQLREQQVLVVEVVVVKEVATVQTCFMLVVLVDQALLLSVTFKMPAQKILMVS
jgi:hypothetical protein